MESQPPPAIIRSCVANGEERGGDMERGRGRGRARAGMEPFDWTAPVSLPLSCPPDQALSTNLLLASSAAPSIRFWKTLNKLMTIDGWLILHQQQPIGDSIQQPSDGWLRHVFSGTRMRRDATMCRCAVCGFSGGLRLLPGASLKADTWRKCTVKIFYSRVPRRSSDSPWLH